MSTPIVTQNAPGAIGPYSQAVMTGNLLFISGQLGIDVHTGNLGKGIEEQTRLALGNVEAIVREAGGTMEDVIKVTIFLADMNDFGVVNGMYSDSFAEPYPARSCVQVARLPKGGLVEVEAVAGING
ncbi:RidA family protein [Desulfoplanes sp.]